jgi:hypothetical protein
MQNIIYYQKEEMQNNGHAVAQAVSCYFPLRQPRLEPGSGYVGFLADKAALVQFFSLPIISLNAPCSSSVTGS